MGSCNPSNCGLNWSMKATSPQNNVALIVASLNSGGTERIASTMANYWSENGANVVIVMLNHGQGVFYPIRPEISIERLSYCKHTHKLKQIIETEDKRMPLTDEQLTELLGKDEYFIARRTVTKYREQQKYPVAKLRKKL